jgi:hypothetical protein
MVKCTADAAMCKWLSRSVALLPWGEHQLATATMVLHAFIGATFNLALSSAAQGWECSIIVIPCPARTAEALPPCLVASRPISSRLYYTHPLRDPRNFESEDR